ncbi:MAG TPA: hypothetical protein VFE63_02535, partial [Roseiarcus sp.]|nr:hypothetical protein [Roseiarcus sp.]
ARKLAGCPVGGAPDDLNLNLNFGLELMDQAVDQEGRSGFIRTIHNFDQANECPAPDDLGGNSNDFEATCASPVTSARKPIG